MKRLLFFLALLVSGAASAQSIQPMPFSDYWFKNQASFGQPTANLTDPSAWVQFGTDNTSKGILLPRVANLGAVSLPAPGLMVYNKADSSVYIRRASGWTLIGSGSGSGSVTSVAMTVPTGLSVSGSPITTAGTFAITTALNGIIKGNGTGFLAVSQLGDADISGLAFSKLTAVPTTIAGYGITDGVTLTGVQTLSNKTLTSPAINFGSDARGDLIVRGATAYSRLALGGSGRVLTSNGTDAVWAELPNSYIQNQPAPGDTLAIPINDSTVGIKRIEAGSGITITPNANRLLISAASLADGDRGDITVSSSGTVWAIDPTVVTFAKIQNVSTGVLIGRSTSGTGSVESLTVGSGLQLSGGVLSATGTTFTIGPISSTPTANGMTLTGTVLNLDPASSTTGGVLKNGSQYLSTGAKRMDSVSINGVQPVDIPFYVRKTVDADPIARFEHVGNSPASIELVSDFRTWSFISQNSGGAQPGHFAIASNGTEQFKMDIIGNTAIGGAVLDDNPVPRLGVANTFTGQVADMRVFKASSAGAQFNTTSGTMTAVTGYFEATATRAAGSNNLNNIAISATASGGQNNYAAFFTGKFKLDLGSDATGDIYYRNSSGDFVGLPIGSANQFLSVQSGLPSWQGPINIYTADGTLSGNRTVTMSSSNLIFSRTTGRVGIGTSGPDAVLDILSTSTPQLRLTHTDASAYADTYVDGSGKYTIDYSGTRAEVKTGTNTKFAGLGGVVQDVTASVSVTGSSAVDVFSYTTEANILFIVGQKFEFDFAGTMINRTGNKVFTFTYAGSSFSFTFTPTLTDASTDTWSMHGFIIRTGSSTAYINVTMNCNNQNKTVQVGGGQITGITFSNTNIFKINCQAPSAGGGNVDITFDAGYMKWYPDYAGGAP